jgi:L-ascorbate metabolism protein UlaG (beta-lactamase superfamily)
MMICQKWLRQNMCRKPEIYDELDYIIVVREHFHHAPVFVAI